MNLYDSNKLSLPRWASFENPEALPGCGGKINNGAKGAPSKVILSGDDVVLLHIEGQGVVRKIWAALDKYTYPDVLRNIFILMYWDGAILPAVECPFADFFALGLAEVHPFESELFSSPEGRSFNCFVPMPFYKCAKIVLSNRSDQNILFFYDIEFTLEPVQNALYFHAFWNREAPNNLCTPYTVLPKTEGHGRYLGTSFGVRTDVEKYGHTWFGEGEIKFYLDGDKDYPTLCGTGTEDYIGDGWGQKTFSHRTQGCIIADDEAGKYSFYRWHTVDPIYFQSDIVVNIQVMGNGSRKDVMKMQKEGVPLRVTVAAGEHVYDPEKPYIIDEGYYGDSVLFYRQDDYSSVAYFYLDRP